MSLYGVKISGTGFYVPETVMSNTDLEKLMDTTDEWIQTRTGIKQRHIAADDQPASALGAMAASRALEVAGMSPAEIELIIVATITPDKIFPNTACFVQKRIGASNATCFSIEAACSGFLYSMEVAAGLLRSGSFRNALVIGAEKLSMIVNWEDRGTCVLFGDGAGAAVLSACAPEENMYLGASLGSDGNYTEILHAPGGGSAMPFSQQVLDDKLQYLAMSGQEVFKLAVNAMSTSGKKVVEDHGLQMSDIAWVIPHQANMRIITSVGKRLEVPSERVYANVSMYGNTSGASIPIALAELAQSGQLKKGDHILLVAFGAGLTWGASLLKW